MSDKAKKEGEEEGGGKKKGKLPILIILVVVLGAGVFLGMKAGGGKKAEPVEPKLELGAIQDLGEILVNLSDGKTYLRTNISVHLEKKFDPKLVEPLVPALRDAAILTLSSKSLEEVNTFDGKEGLKIELAEDMNEILEAGGPTVHAEPDAAPAEKKKAHRATNPENPEWDSQTGPILKVYYKDFATQ